MNFDLSWASWVRKLEDKLVHHRLEWRPFFLPVDTSELHGCREMPAGFQWYLIVSDSTLPSKGTAHRANRGAEKAAFCDLCGKFKQLQCLVNSQHVPNQTIPVPGRQVHRQQILQLEGLDFTDYFSSTKGHQ